MKLYKTIFRIDYPLSYSILDNLGNNLEFIHIKTKESPFTDATSDFNIAQHRILHRAKINNDSFQIHLSINNLVTSIEYNKGYDINLLAKHPVFELTQQVIEKLDIKTFPHYNRIGLRNWVLIEHNSLIFESILNFMSQSNLCFDEVIKNNFANTNDIAIIFESKNEDNIYLRVILGPYQKNERIKYFTFEPSVNEGLILDVDIWEENISIPGFNLLELTKKYQSILFSLCQNIFTKLLERMKKDE